METVALRMFKNNAIDDLIRYKTVLNEDKNGKWTSEENVNNIEYVIALIDREMGIRYVEKDECTWHKDCGGNVNIYKDSNNLVYYCDKCYKKLDKVDMSKACDMVFERRIFEKVTTEDLYDIQENVKNEMIYNENLKDSDRDGLEVIYREILNELVIRK